MLYFISAAAYAEEFSLEFTADTRYSDNIGKTNKNQQSDFKNELSAALVFDRNASHYRTSNRITGRYITYSKQTYDDQLRWDGYLSLDYIFHEDQKKAFTWRFYDSHYQSLIDRNGRDVETNLADVNTFETGPRYFFQITKRTSFLTQLLYVRNKASVGEADSDVVTLLISLDHAFTQFYSMALSYDYNKIGLSLGREYYKQNIGLGFNLKRKHYELVGSVGAVSFTSDILAGDTDENYFLSWLYTPTERFGINWFAEQTLTDTATDINTSTVAPNFVNDLILRRRTKLTMNYNYEDWRAEFYYLYIDETYTFQKTTDKRVGPGIMLSRINHFSDIWSGKFSIDMYLRDYNQTNDNDYAAKQFNGRIDFERKSSDKLGLNFGYAFEYRGSALTDDGYTSNELFLGVKY